MKRGEIWTVSGGPDYLGKARPAVIIQSDAFSETGSITVCPITSHDIDVPLLRLEMMPEVSNGLNQVSRVMIDKVATVSRAKLGSRRGVLHEDQMSRLSRMLIEFLALA